MTLTFPNFKTATEWADAREFDAMVVRVEGWDDGAPPYDMLRDLDEMEVREVADVRWQLRRRYGHFQSVTLNALFGEWYAAVAAHRDYRSVDGGTERWDVFQRDCRAARLNLLAWLKSSLNAPAPIATSPTSAAIPSARARHVTSAGDTSSEENSSRSPTTRPVTRSTTQPLDSYLIDAMPAVLTAEGAAELLLVSASHVSRLGNEGELDRIRLNGVFYYTVDSVYKYIGRRDEKRLPVAKREQLKQGRKAPVRAVTPAVAPTANHGYRCLPCNRTFSQDLEVCPGCGRRLVPLNV